MSVIERVNRCQFCSKTFARKSWFLRHSCAKKRKFEETQDVVVQQGFRVYAYWLQVQNMVRRGKEPSFDKFLKSPVKKDFIKLVLFCRENGIISVYSYVDWLIETRKRSRDWFSDAPPVMDAFKEYIDVHENPEDQALCTLKEIERWILENPTQRSAEEFFSKLSPGVILTWVRQRKLKPWPLLTYAPISDKWLDDKFYNAETFYRIDDLINCDYWADKIADDPDSAELVSQVMDQIWEFQT